MIGSWRRLDIFYVALPLCAVVAGLGIESPAPSSPPPPELSMLFAAGTGVGLLFWGVAEPVNHFAALPLGEGGTSTAAREAAVYTIFQALLTHPWVAPGASVSAEPG